MIKIKKITDKQYKQYLNLKYGKKRGFIDKCYIFSTVFVCGIVTAAYIAVIVSGTIGITDMSPLTTTIEKAFEWELVFTGFVVWKAKVENCRKHKDVNRLESLESEDTICQ